MSEVHTNATNPNIPEGWEIRLNERPYSSYKYMFISDNYDGAPDSDTRHLLGEADTVSECIEMIKEDYLDDAA